MITWILWIRFQLILGNKSSMSVNYILHRFCSKETVSGYIFSIMYPYISASAVSKTQAGNSPPFSHLAVKDLILFFAYFYPSLCRTGHHYKFTIYRSHHTGNGFQASKGKCSKRFVNLALLFQKAKCKLIIRFFSRRELQTETFLPSSYTGFLRQDTGAD